MTIDFSIVIRSKNESKWLPFTLGAIRSQIVKNLEVILVDNQSIDNTVEVAKNLGVEKLTQIDEFRPGLALNLGVSLAEGSKVVFLSAHCIPTDDQWLLSLDQALDREKKVFCAYGRQVPISITSDKDRRDLINTFGLDSKIQVKDFFFHNANSIVFKDYIERYPFDETVTNVEDRLWGKQVIERGDRIGYTPAASVFHYHGINHDNEPSRLRKVTSLIRPLYESDGDRNVSLPNPGVKILAVVLSDEKSRIDQAILVQIVQTLQDAYSRIRPVIVSCFPYEIDNSANILRRDIPELDHGSILSAMKSVLEHVELLQGEVYDHVLFINPQYIIHEADVLNKLITQHLSELLDLTFCAKDQKSNVWQTSEEGLSPLSSNKLFYEDNESLYVAFYGLGTIATRNLLFTEQRPPQFVGVLELPREYRIERWSFE
jgi:rhamnosyltransferase